MDPAQKRIIRCQEIQQTEGGEGKGGVALGLGEGRNRCKEALLAIARAKNFLPRNSTQGSGKTRGRKKILA